MSAPDLRAALKECQAQVTGSGYKSEIAAGMLIATEIQKLAIAVEANTLEIKKLQHVNTEASNFSQRSSTETNPVNHSK